MSFDLLHYFVGFFLCQIPNFLKEGSNLTPNEEEQTWKHRALFLFCFVLFQSLFTGCMTLGKFLYLPKTDSTIIRFVHYMFWETIKL